MLSTFSFNNFNPPGKLICLIILSVFSLSGFAKQPEPFLSRDQSPFSIIFGLPLASSAKLLTNNQSRWTSSLNISNTINAQDNASENLFIDVETSNLNFLYDYNFKDNWMLRVQLPYVAHSGGFLDSFIDQYHKTLGLPEDIRPFFPNDQVDINLSSNGNSFVDINSTQSALGDISLQMAWQAHQSEQSAVSYWLSLKLPTGNANKLTGSGATDIAGWGAMNYRLTETRWLYGQGGLLYMGNSDIFKSIQNNFAVFGNAGIKFQPWNSIELKAQLDFHSAFYDSNLEFLGPVIQLTFGGSYIINEKHKLDFAVAEDIKTGASPDVNFNISWFMYFNK